MWRNTLQSVTVRKEESGGKYKLMGLKPRLLSELALGILCPLHWGGSQNHIQWGAGGGGGGGGGFKITFSGGRGGGVSKSHSVGGGGGSQNHIQWGEKYECFSSASALSPAKYTFTVGKTNTNNYHIDFWGFFLS